MTLAEYIKINITDTFAAIPLSSCLIVKERLITDGMSHAVMMAVPYPHGAGRIASFARLRDYHAFFASFEEEIRSLLGERYPGCSVGVFSDHSPIDERGAAVRAGLGVRGDNGLFITEKYGSFVFLGEIVCSLGKKDLISEGIEVKDDGDGECLHCGICASLCPAECIGGDKSLCISALTQKKGLLSDTECDIIRSGKSAWGCDICGACCPMNEEKTAAYNEFFLNETIDPKHASDIETMSDEDFAKYPFSWRRRETIIRNFNIIDSHGESDD
ncbi:MAG: epoxyqueuosine reductase [Clostridia bacterium]|nr:epoxyqueuosine reductase [Clostridia bacterium]